MQFANGFDFAVKAEVTAEGGAVSTVEIPSKSRVGADIEGPVTIEFKTADGTSMAKKKYKISAKVCPRWGFETTKPPEAITVKGQFKTPNGTAICLGVIYDPDMVKIYNKERIASDSQNAKGNYFNYFMSLEDIYACSPYKNFVCFMLD